MSKYADPWMRLVDKFTNVGSPPAGTPHGWIQWKGTSVCMDIRCACGELTHIDADFAYLIQCGKCKRVYWPNAHVQLIELTGDDLKNAKACNDGDGHHFVVSE